MHSEWSDGNPDGAGDCGSLPVERGYAYAAVTDHSYGLKIAGGMSMAEAADQRRAIDEVNVVYTRGDSGCCRGSKRISTLPGSWIWPTMRRRRSRWCWPHRTRDCERTRIRPSACWPQSSSRPSASWPTRAGGSPDRAQASSPIGTRVFALAARRGVAIEIDGDPSRQDLDYTLARRALEAGCVFALDSDAHTTTQLAYSETAVAHARLAAIPADRIVNCWPTSQLMAWLSDPSSARQQTL